MPRSIFHFQVTPTRLCLSLFWFPRSECWICSEEGTEVVQRLHMLFFHISIFLELLEVRVPSHHPLVLNDIFIDMQHWISFHICHKLRCNGCRPTKYFKTNNNNQNKYRNHPNVNLWSWVLLISLRSVQEPFQTYSNNNQFLFLQWIWIQLFHSRDAL